MPIGSEIIVCEQRFDVGCKVVTFADDPAFSAYTLHRTDKPDQIYPFSPAAGMGTMAARYRPRRLIGSDRSLGRLRQVLRQFVIHHDGCQSSRQCFHVLHNERGLSVHFLIDNDGTIYQTLDLVDCGFQAAGVNEISIGVELANRGDAHRFPGEYGGRREKVTCRVQGHQFLAYAYTPAQVESMIALGRAVSRILPGIAQASPIGGDLEPVWGALSDPRDFVGYLGHYHVTPQKWDPGPFDFKRLTSSLRGRVVFPMAVVGSTPDIPDGEEEATDAVAELYRLNEEEGEGGYYPVGPLGQSRLWHGGVHLRAERGAPVYAPLGGKIVAARMTEECPIGSRNFVLIRHELPIGTTSVTFFTLLFHLDQETQGPAAPRWWRQAAAQLGEDPVPLSIDISAGELIGHVGEAGPPGRFEGQVHVEIMSADDLGAAIEPGFWRSVDGAAMGRFCSAREVLDLIDRGPRKDGILTRAELLGFFRGNPRRQELRRLAVRHLSEWADRGDWQAALARARDFAALPRAMRARLYEDQIEPVLWWTDEIGEAAGLPDDKIVWTYHPVTFLTWIREQLRTTKVQSTGIAAASEFKGTAAPADIKDDAEATEGFTDDEDVYYGAGGKKLELEDLVRGYPDDKR